jgi:hypothetical protein
LLLLFPSYHHQNCLLYFSRREGKLKERKGAIKQHSGHGSDFQQIREKGLQHLIFSLFFSCFSGGLCLFYLDRGDLVWLFIPPFDLFLAAFSIGLGDWLVALLCSRPFYTLQNVHSVAHNNKNGSFSFILENYITLHHTFYTLYAYLR